MDKLAESAVKRHPGNPVLAAKDVPYPSTCVFNAGVAKYRGRYVTVFRNDYGRQGDPHFDGRNLGLAYSDDGLAWKVEPKPLVLPAGVPDMYDPRLTVMDGRCYMCFASDSDGAIRGGIAVTDDFREFKVLSLSVPDNRNMVLFPDKVGGKYVRLERPFPVYFRGFPERFDIWISDSPDLVYWGNSRLLLDSKNVAFCNSKIGPAAPPVRTPKGWLTTFHTVDFDPARGKNGWEKQWKKRYCAGIMLLDLTDPSRIVGIHPAPLLAPEAPYETEGGFRNDVVFPCGMIIEDSGEVKIYYGAADTVTCLARADVGDLLALCGR